MTRIILDTDMDTDCDDAGALAVLHNLSRQGHAEILGVICSVSLDACARFVLCANRWYRREDIRIGLVSEAVWQRNVSYATYHEHRKTVRDLKLLYNELIPVADPATERFEDAVALYRELLSRQPDGSVTICSIGTLTALSQLLRSPPDRFSPLSGEELVARKVSKLVSTCEAAYPHGKDSFNWRMDREATAHVCSHWPTALYAQPVGREVPTGMRFVAETSADNPVRQAYEIWRRVIAGGLRPTGAQKDAICSLLTPDERKNYCTWLDETQNPIRPSWDQLTVLFSVLGDAELFAVKGPLSISFDPETGEHQWGDQPQGKPRYLIQSNTSNANLARVVESLMISPPEPGQSASPAPGDPVHESAPPLPVAASPVDR